MDGPTGKKMLFIVDKCSVMHLGKGNRKFRYDIGGVNLRVSEGWRDLGLGVIMHNSAKPSRQCAEASKRANRILGMINRTIVSSRNQDVVLGLYKSLGRLRLVRICTGNSESIIRIFVYLMT